MAERGPKVKEGKNTELPRGIFLRGGIYWIRYGNGEGKTIRESTLYADLKKAQNLLTLRKAAVLEGKLPEIHASHNGKTFNDLAKYYLENISIKKAAYVTEKYCIPIIQKWIGHMKLSKINKKTAGLVQELVQTERGKSEPTANRYVALFKNMMTVAYEEKWINFSVLEDVRRIKMYSEVIPNIKPLTPDECVELIKKAPCHIRNALVIGIYTGLRRYDVLNLKWENVDFESGTISLLINKTINTKKVVETHYIDMGVTLRIFLENSERYGEYVVSKPDGTKFKTIKESFDKARLAIGKPHLRLHDLRHTFASILVQNGTDIYTISLMLGHSTTQMTKRYAHLLPQHFSKETKKLDGIIKFTDSDMREMNNQVIICEDMELKLQKTYRKIDTDFS